MNEPSAVPHAAVIGWPVEHSLSPVIHGYWLRHYGIAGSYEKLLVSPEELSTVLSGLQDRGLVGANVTIPHKIAALQAVDRVTAVAERIGAVNTLYFDSGALVGDNSDAEGFAENLRANATTWLPASGPAVVLGAGGAARAVVVALLDAGVPELRLLNRTRSRAEALAKDFGERLVVSDWQERDASLRGAALLINTTSLGMVGQPPLALRLDALPLAAVVNDIVYKPLETNLLAQARARGNKAVDGLGMLLYQARPGFHRWFGRLPEVTKALSAEVIGAMA
jgi:shikimate dehydrogenase